MRYGRFFSSLAACVVAGSSGARAQAAPSGDPVIQRLWTLGMDSSQTYGLAQALLDSIGPRLTGSPGFKAASDWVVSRYRSWGVEARQERYGAWAGWRRGVTHVDLTAPRLRTLEATMLAWSAGTKGAVKGSAVLLPEAADTPAFRAALKGVRGRFVLVSAPRLSCRPDTNLRAFATPATLERMQQEQAAVAEAWTRRQAITGTALPPLVRQLDSAGALGVLTSRWSGGWGVNKVMGAAALAGTRIPVLDLSCEDYGLVARLAERNQGPVLRVTAEATRLGEVPVFNTIATIRGSEKPEEYVVLSAHFDSWDGASGATDNGTGTLTVLEAMRLLRAAYPAPKRTIIAGHWGGEEQGLNGSRAFSEDHPEVRIGLQALFNQDNGTGRTVQFSMQGLTGAGAQVTRWLASVPASLTREIKVTDPGTPTGGGSDNASFSCHGLPGFSLSALPWEYGTYTWHTNRDTFDKVVFDDLEANATLMAMLAYSASEDPQLIPRDRVDLAAAGNSGQPTTWPECKPAARVAP